MGEKESKDNSKTLLVSIQSSWLSLPLLSHITTHSLTHKHFKFKKSNFKKSNFENFFPLPLSLSLSLFANETIHSENPNSSFHLALPNQFPPWPPSLLPLLAGSFQILPPTAFPISASPITVITYLFPLGTRYITYFFFF